MLKKIRYATSEVKAALGIQNTKFWRLVKEGRLRTYYDGGRVFVSAADLERYDAECQKNTTGPSASGRPHAIPGVKGVQAQQRRRGKAIAASDKAAECQKNTTGPSASGRPHAILGVKGVQAQQRRRAKEAV